jgi:hypothetical protein
MGSTASAQFLKVGPVIFNASLNNSWILSSNVNGLSKDEAREQGLDREDFYTTYGFSINGTSKLYPDITLNASTSATWEEHFIQERNASDPNLPLLGNSAFTLGRTFGHYSFNLNMNHSASTSRDKTNVPIFVPGNDPLVRDIIQTSNAGASFGWNRKELAANLNYTWGQVLHNEEFNQGNSRTQTYGLSFNYTPWQRFSMNYGFNSSKNELLENKDVDSKWLRTQTLSASYRILERPSLTYTSGFEKEDDRFVLGKWEPNHSWTLSDFRSITETISYSINTTYTYDENPEEDDISFIYGGSLNHEVTRNLRHGVNLTRSPVETFGSTVTTDSTSLGYVMTVSSPLIRGASASLGANYSRNELRGELAGPVEETIDYTASFNKTTPLPLSRKLTGNINYSYLFNSSNTRETYDIHSLTLTMSYQL